MVDTNVISRSRRLLRPARRSKATATARPLCVDLDGTLIRTDILLESLLMLLRRNIFFLFLIPLWLMRGKAALKAEIATRVKINPRLLPYNAEFLAFLRREKAKGRKLVLATASHEKPARSIAKHLGIFDAVLASTNKVNLKGEAKRARLETDYGAGEFDYAGNGKVDVPILRAAHDCILVNPEPGAHRLAVKAGVNIVEEFDDRSNTARGYLKALRFHQWLKNTLIFIPLLLSHLLFDVAALQQAMLAFLAFGLCASSVYILNDLLDLADDRRHPEKKNRPFASGAIPVSHGLALSPLLLTGAAFLAMLLPWEFALVLSAYYVMTLGYSFFFKRTLLFDVIVLAALYTSRIVAGSAALALDRSPWLLAFSVFVFFSLALVKRYVELGEVKDIAAKLSERARGYRGVDRETLSQVGITSGLLSVLVLALYIDSDTVKANYPHPEIIWFLCPLMLYLITRIWVLARRGELPGDPVLFAARDWRSQVIVVLGALLMTAAAL